MTNEQAINHIKTTLLNSISKNEGINDALTFARGLGLSFFTAHKLVREINEEVPWYGRLTDHFPLGE